MSCLVHLRDHDADYQTRRLCEGLAGSRMDGLTQVVRVIGRNQVLGAARRLKEAGDVGLVHAWGIRALTAAIVAGSEAVIYTPGPETSDCPHAWLGWLARRRGVAVEALGRMIASAIPPWRNPHPSPLPDYRERGKEGAMAPGFTRRELGLSDDDFVVLAPGESTRGARHEMAVWSVTILHELDRRWRLLVWGRGRRVESMLSLVRRLGSPQVMCQVPGAEFEQLPALADAALVTSDAAAATLPIGITMAAGIAVVAARNSPAANWVGDDGVVEDSPRAMAQKLMDIRADAGLRQELAGAAKRRAAEVFSWERFAGEYDAVYRRALARPRRS